MAGSIQRGWWKRWRSCRGPRGPIGAEDGYWLPWLSEAIGWSGGRIYAVEVDDAKSRGSQSGGGGGAPHDVMVMRGIFDDPELPYGTIDLAMICLTDHIEVRPADCHHLRRDLSARGGVAHLDDPDDVPVPFRWFHTERHWSDAEAMRRGVAEGGYRRVASYDFLPLQSFRVFAPADGAAATRVAPRQTGVR